MEEYFVNKKAESNGYHEVHKNSCFYLPLEANRTSIGFFYNCYDAVTIAKEIYTTVNGCIFCSNECYHR